MDAPDLERVRQAVGDRYEVRALHGRGGMGAVFVGEHRALGSPIAIKVLPVPADEGTDELARFSREARLAANLPHPHIVPVFEFDVRDGLAFFIMPFVKGQSLAERLTHDGRLPREDVEEMLREIGAALSFAHERGVVHRDVKPANILQEEATGRWLLADFGVARPTAGEGLTLSGFAVGTPAYMAPEQAAGRSDTDGRADLYGLAAVACEALTGHRPDVMKDALEIQMAVRAARPDLPGGFVRAITAGLALDRDKRPPSVEAWCEDLRIPTRSGVSGTRPRPGRSRVGLIAGGLLALTAGAIGVLTLRDRASAGLADDATTIAIAPFDITGTLPDTALRDGLPRVLADQVRWIPSYRVVPPAAVAQVLATLPPASGVEASLRALAERLDADEVLFGTVTGDTSGQMSLEVRVHAAVGGAPARQARVAGPVESLAEMVSQLVRDAFAERAAAERAGWAASLPRGWAAVRAWLEGDRLFRAGLYDAAIGAFDDVIAQDSAFAPAYFKRMLCEVMRLNPTRATDALRSAVGQASTFRADLDPITTELLSAYELIVARGDLEAAHERLEEITRSRPTAVDAWFVLGYLEFYLGGLLQIPPDVSQFKFERAHELDPQFAGPIAQLALLTALEGENQAARRHFAEYLAVDSTSVWAELVRMSDSLLAGGGRALAVNLSFDRRSVQALEIFALGGGRFDAQPLHRAVARDAIAALERRAGAAQDRRIAFRLNLANLLGTGRWASADTLMAEAARRRVPIAETDAWRLLAAISGTAVLGDEANLVRAGERLAGDTADATSMWLVARWAARAGDAASGRAARDRLRGLMRADPTRPLTTSLWLDLAAHDSLAMGDSAAALRTWRRAVARFDVGAVPFGLAGSLWPLQLDRARVAGARKDHDEVIVATTPFELTAGYNDQVAWWVALPLRAHALEAKGDVLGARNLRLALVEIWSDANGAAARELARIRGGSP